MHNSFTSLPIPLTKWTTYEVENEASLLSPCNECKAGESSQANSRQAMSKAQGLLQWVGRG